VELSGVRLGRRGDDRLQQALADAEQAELTYDHPGSTLREGSTPGVADRSFALEVRGDVAAAAAALRRWVPHAGIRARIHPANAAMEVGTTVLVVAPFGPFEMAVPDRIVAVVDEPTRFGFAYGTLAGHAEAGEELFLAEQVARHRLRLTVRVHARPATWPARLGAPLVTLLQRAAARRYLDAWAAEIERSSEPSS
jgi:uncharacterized protein (UPF0548 family)